MHGLCGCGCDQPTEIAPETRPRRGWIRGSPKPFLRNHSKRKWTSRDGVTKRCPKCDYLKLLEDFHKSIHSVDGVQILCKTCRAKYALAYRQTTKGKERLLLGSRNYNLRGHYGLSSDGYRRFHDSQNGLCAICKKAETSTFLGTVRRLAVDHDHITGKIRGLLCNACNRGVSNFRDDPELMEAAASYLRSSLATVSSAA
jgi:hypothetical protein